MPDLSHLESLIPNLMTALLAAEGKYITPKERLYVRVFVRLVQKAKDEYRLARENVIAEVEEQQRSAEEMTREGRRLYVFGFVNHMENCLNACRRLFLLLDAVKSEHGGLHIERLLRKKIEASLRKVGNFRGAVEHIEGEIQRGETSGPIMLTVSDDDHSIIIANYSLEFSSLTSLLENFHELAKQWLTDFCKELQ